MVPYIPDLEFWFTGSAFIGVASFLFTTGLAVIGVKSHGRLFYQCSVWAGVALTGALWWNLAQQEAAKAKPERDYVYFTVPPPASQEVDSEGKVRLWYVATGLLKDAEIAIQRTEDSEKGRTTYLFFEGGLIFREGVHRSGLFLPMGDYTFDLDSVHRAGQVSERLRLTKTENGVVAQVDVRRKHIPETLIPPPQKIPLSHIGILAGYVLAFAVFGVALFLVSQHSNRSTPGSEHVAGDQGEQNRRQDKQNLDRLNLAQQAALERASLEIRGPVFFDRRPIRHWRVAIYNYGPAVARNVSVRLLNIEPRPRSAMWRADYPYCVTRVSTHATQTASECRINPATEEVFEIASTWISGEGKFIVGGIDTKSIRDEWRPSVDPDERWTLFYQITAENADRKLFSVALCIDSGQITMDRV